MSPKSFLLTEPIARYLGTHNPPVDEVAQSLINETEALGGIGRMQIAPEQAAFMAFLTGLLHVSFAVEVGTFTGYSALSVARAMPPSGRLLCCDTSKEWTAIARRHWDMAGVTDRIDLRIAPALETLRSLPLEPSIDLAFIDADKTNYTAYYTELVERLQPDGVILVDNTLWSGKVIDPAATDEDTVALRAFNDHVAADSRVESVLLPIADGLTLVRRAARI